MMILLYFVFGLYFGSFLHVIAYRIPKGYYLTPRNSVCEICNIELTWNELVPVISYLLQKGRCKKCKEKISIMHPISELMFGIVIVLYSINYNTISSLVLGWIFISILFVLSIADIYYYILPNKMMFCLLILILIWKPLLPNYSIWNAIISTLFSIILLAILMYLTNGGMGIGDYKLLILLAYFFELHLFLKLLILASSFALVYFLLLSLQKQLHKESYIFFGPFISLAAYLLLLYYF